MLKPELRKGTVAFQWNENTPQSYLEEFEKATELFIHVISGEDGSCLNVGSEVLYDGDYVLVYPDKTLDVFSEYGYSVRFGK
jgi:hypothetical protein